MTKIVADEIFGPPRKDRYEDIDYIQGCRCHYCLIFTPRIRDLVSAKVGPDPTDLFMEYFGISFNGQNSRGSLVDVLSSGGEIHENIANQLDMVQIVLQSHLDVLRGIYTHLKGAGQFIPCKICNPEIADIIGKRKALTEYTKYNEVGLDDEDIDKVLLSAGATRTYEYLLRKYGAGGIVHRASTQKVNGSVIGTSYCERLAELGCVTILDKENFFTLRVLGIDYKCIENQATLQKMRKAQKNCKIS